MFSRSARAGRAIAIILSCAAFVGGFQATDAEGPRAAKAALFNARYDIAADLYRKELARNPGWGVGYYGLVRALLRSRLADEAFKAAQDGLHNAANTPGAEAAAGLASFRHGDLDQSERHFRAALKSDSKYPGALAGLASIYSPFPDLRPRAAFA
jgi:Flp pilus assembly protein TadD